MPWISHPALDESYADFLVQYNGSGYDRKEFSPNQVSERIDDDFSVWYIPLKDIPRLTMNTYSYNAIPKCYGQMDTEHLNAAGIYRLHQHPYLQLRGQNTMVAVIDSGIDYRHPAFLRGGRTRIAAIWDQSIPGTGTEVPYGTEYTGEEIQRALESEDPFAVVPSRDENGHGTFLAGTAAGSDIPEADFSGAAPEAALIVVKLKQAKAYLRDFYLLPEGAAVYQENDIMFALEYVRRKSREMGRPLSVCLGVGTNLGAHRGDSPLGQLLNRSSHHGQQVYSVAAGNEGNARHHFAGEVSGRGGETAVELRVGEGEEGFVTEFWGESPEFYSMRIQSPTGEILPVATLRGNELQTLSFIFVETVIEVSYVAVERQSGESLFFFRFLKPAAGIWKFLVSGGKGQEMAFHMWLPIENFVSLDTYFLQSSPYHTVTSPGDAKDVLTMTAYSPENNSLYLAASRGYFSSGILKPDLTAPGVDVFGAAEGGGYTTRSGTSVAAAVTAGAAALLLEWAIVRENALYLNGISAKNYLIRGAGRNPDMVYPNPEWGYGMLDLYRVFEELF